MVFVLSASGMLATGMRETLISAGSPGRALVMQQNRWSEQRSRLPQAMLGRVSAAPAVKRDAQGQPLVTGETVSHVMLASVVDAGRISTIQVRGVAANVFALRPSVHLVEGRAIQPGTPEAIIGRGVAGRFEGLSVGGNIELAAGRPIAIVGVFESGRSAYESEVWTDLEAARSSLALEGFLSSATAELEDPDRLDAFAVPLTADRQTGVTVERESAYYTKVSGGLADVIAVLGVAETILFSLGAILGTMVVCYASVVQRRQELGVLRALGFPRRSILAALLLGRDPRASCCSSADHPTAPSSAPTGSGARARGYNLSKAAEPRDKFSKRGSPASAARLRGMGVNGWSARQGRPRSIHATAESRRPTSRAVSRAADRGAPGRLGNGQARSGAGAWRSCSWLVSWGPSSRLARWIWC